MLVGISVAGPIICIFMLRLEKIAGAVNQSLAGAKTGMKHRVSKGTEAGFVLSPPEL